MTFNLLSLVAGIMYIALGIFVLKSHSFLMSLPPKAAWAFGSLLILYGVFRFTRALMAMRRKNPK